MKITESELDEYVDDILDEKEEQKEFVLVENYIENAKEIYHWGLIDYEQYQKLVNLFLKFDNNDEKCEIFFDEILKIYQIKEDGILHDEDIFLMVEDCCNRLFQPKKKTKKTSVFIVMTFVFLVGFLLLLMLHAD